LLICKCLDDIADALFKTIAEQQSKQPGGWKNGSESTPLGQITYKITFTNNDSAACAPATMQLYTNILNSSGTGVGFSASFQPQSITLGGGQTATSLLQVTSPANLVKGNYTTWVSIQNLTTNFNALTSGTLVY
jgi:hypothetical protein